MAFCNGCLLQMLVSVCICFLISAILRNEEAEAIDSKSLNGCAVYKSYPKSEKIAIENFKLRLLQDLGIKKVPRITPSQFDKFKKNRHVNQLMKEYEEKAEMVKTQTGKQKRLSVFATNYETNGYRFDFTRISENIEVESSFLFVYFNQGVRGERIRIHRYASRKNGRVKKILYKSVLVENNRNWQKIEVTELTTGWVNKTFPNYGFEVECFGASTMRKFWSNHNFRHRLDINLLAAEGRHRGKRATVTRDCDVITRCCMKEIVINFVKEGWGFVIAPRVLHLTYCTGTCLFPYSASYLRLFAYIHNHFDSPGNVPVCCSPVRKSPVNLLTAISQSQFELTTHYNLKVEECGCI